jgi:hypothetical protein
MKQKFYKQFGKHSKINLERKFKKFRRRPRLNFKHAYIVIPRNRMLILQENKQNKTLEKNA